LVGGNNLGELSSNNSNITNIVRPVLSLKSCVLVSRGNGTADSPYEVELPSSCASAIN